MHFIVGSVYLPEQVVSVLEQLCNFTEKPE